MKGQLYIDGVDAYSDFGAWITEGGYDNLFSFPALVAPDKNSWPEEDGVEVDLSSPALSGKEVSISFVASNPQINADEFISYIARPGYRIVRVPALGKEWKLRLLSHPDNVVYGTTANRLVAFSLNFADDFPMRVSEYQPASGGGVILPSSGYLLDGKGLDRYGILIEKGRDSTLKSAAVKQNLTRKFKSTDGVLYDADTLVFSEKDVTFKCCLIADTIERFWQCYTAFFNDLIKPGERLLGYDETGKNYKCYYKNTSGWKLQSLTGRVIAEFNLTLVFTAFRVSGNITYLLATEDGAFVSTEDDSCIDVSLIRKVAPTSYMPTLSVAAPASASSSGEETEIRKRKITEMPEAGSLDNLIVPAVDRATNRNVHVPVSRLSGSGGSGGGNGNIRLLTYEEYMVLPDKRSDTLYACLDRSAGRITKAYVGIYPLLCTTDVVGDKFTYTFPFRLGGNSTDNKSFNYIFPFVLQ